MRIEIIVLAALAALASAAPQWPYRDAVAPYYYGYPGKTPYMYRSGYEDDEMEETHSLGRQDLKVGTKDSGSTVTVVEDDEKADGVQVVETGSAKPLKPVAQSANNNHNQPQQDQQQQPAAASQAQQPLSTNNANNAEQQTANSGQPLTVQQPGQQPPAFPPARPANRPARPTEDEDEDEEDEESEEDEEDADAEDEEDGDGDDDDDDDDEEDDEDRRRDNIVQKEAASSEEPAQQSVQEEPQASVATSEGSDEIAQEEHQPAPAAVEQIKPQPIPSQTAVLSNKVNKNKQSVAAAAAVPAIPKNKKKAVATKVKPSSGAIEALVPGYVTDQGEVLVPVDTVTGSQPITIVPDPFSPPSRIVSGPRPIPQSAVPSTPSRQVPYWYRNSPAINPLTDEPESLTRQTLYTPVPPPGSIFTFDDDDDDDEDDADDSPAVIPGNKLRQDAEDDDDEGDDEDEEEEDRKKKAQPPQKVPLAAVPAVGSSGEDDEAEALAFVNSGRPVANKKPATATGTGSGSGAGSGTSGNKKPTAGKPGSSNESDSEEDPESEEDDVSNEEDEDEEEDDVARAVGASPAQIAANPLNRARNYVDEELVSFPPSRSPTVFAVIQGKFPGSVSQRQQSQYISTANPGNPYQRYVVRVTPANRPNRPSPVYYRPVESGPPNRRVVPVASFDVSVEDTRPSSAGVDSDEDSVSIGGPTPVTSYPFVYKVQGSLSGLRPSSGALGPQSLAALLGRPPRPSLSYYGAAFGSSSSGPKPPRPGQYGGGYGPRPPYSFAAAVYGSGSSYGPRPSPSFSYEPRPSPSFSYEGRPSPSFSYGPRPYGPRPSPSFSHGPPRPSGLSGGPPVIVRRKQPGGGPNRPPKPHLIAVYNPTGSSSPGPREPVEEEYYTFEVPEHNTKVVPVGGGGGPSKNKRPTVHRKPTPVVHQKFVSQQDEESSEEQAPAVRPPPQQVQIIPQGTVRRRIRGGKQLKPKKNSKKTVSLSKKQQQQDQQDPLGLLSKINKSKTKMH